MLTADSIDRAPSELTMGDWVIGQYGQMGHHKLDGSHESWVTGVDPLPITDCIFTATVEYFVQTNIFAEC
jgi:hypothetical protein